MKEFAALTALLYKEREKYTETLPPQKPLPPAEDKLFFVDVPTATDPPKFIRDAHDEGLYTGVTPYLSPWNTARISNRILAEHPIFVQSGWFNDAGRVINDPLPTKRVLSRPTGIARHLVAEHDDANDFAAATVLRTKLDDGAKDDGPVPHSTENDSSKQSTEGLHTTLLHVSASDNDALPLLHDNPYKPYRAASRRTIAGLHGVYQLEMDIGQLVFTQHYLFSAEEHGICNEMMELVNLLNERHKLGLTDYLSRKLRVFERMSIWFT